ncbi:DNA adenine methylase [Streptococcus suis]|nr:DNA adenine methylase [Streptococcus suis]NQO44611.1 DNA adenine methylase [Streptococcus suis]NQO55249.1 DNA adenine methylase [Streptococcus suis]
MKITYSPLRYPGGKSKLYEYVRELIRLNNCTTYIEPYAGGAGVALKLLLNNDVNQIMINDYDKAIYALWYSILNYTEELIQLIEETPISIDEWYIQKSIQENKEQTENLLKLGFSTLFLNRVNRSGIIKGGVIGGKHQSGLYKMDCRFNKSNIIDRIKLIASVRNKIKLYNLDAEVFIKKSISRTKNSLTFFDPPYYEKGPGLYTNFYTYEDHKQLSETIKKYMYNKKWIMTYDVHDAIKVMYDGYDNKIYYLNYSVTNPSKGREYIFYSKNLKIGSIADFLELVQE